jgi:hypothetical protein
MLTNLVRLLVSRGFGRGKTGSGSEGVLAIREFRLGFAPPSVSECEPLWLSASSASGGLTRLSALDDVGVVEVDVVAVDVVKVDVVEVAVVEVGVVNVELLKIFLPGFNECVNRGR